MGTQDTSDDEEWITKDGRTILVRDMTEQHAKNALRLMIRRANYEQAEADSDGMDGYDTYGPAD